MDARKERPSQPQKYCVSWMQRWLGRVQCHSASQPSGPVHTSPRPQSRLDAQLAGPAGSAADDSVPECAA